MMTALFKRRTLLLAVLAPMLAACAGSYKQATLSYLDGNAFYQEKIAFPRDKTLLRIRLLDVSDTSAAPAILAEQSLEKVGTPANYSLCYDAQNAQSGHRYAVDARLFVDGELRMQGQSAVERLDGKASGPQIKMQTVSGE